MLALQLLSRMAGHRGGRAAETFRQTLSQEELRAPGCRWSPVSRRCETPSDTTFQRVMADTDPASLERVAQRWTQPRTREAKVLAADGKRIRGANRLSPEGLHWETVTPVDHATGVPVASRSDREEGGERQALRDLLAEVDLRGRVITLDAGHAGKEIREVIVKQHGGDVVVTLKGNCPETCATLRGLSRAGSEYRAASEEWTRSKGRWERRSIGVFAPLRGLLDYPCAQQAWRLQRETRNGPVTVTHACGVTSLLPKRASAADLPGMLRRHWEVENGNHYRRDVTLGEDRSRIRTGHGPAVNAALNNLVPALTPSKGETDLPPFRCAGLSGNLTGSRNTGSTIDSPKKNRPCGLKIARPQLPTHVLAGDLEGDERPQALPAPLLRALFERPASLRPDPAAGTLVARLMPMATQARDEALARLVAELNRSETIYPGTDLRLVYELLVEPEPPAPGTEPPPA